MEAQKSDQQVLRTGDDILLSASVLEQVLRNVLSERQGSVDPAAHREHHEFITECAPVLRDMLEQRRKRQEFWSKIRETAVGTVVIAIVGGAISALAFIGHLVLQAIHSGQGPR